MTLKSFGCSFIYGSDLADEDDGEPYTLSSQLTWPALLAQDINYDYRCYARPGSGNLRILEKILTQVAESDHRDLFVVGWSWIDRFDYTVDPSDKNHRYVLHQYDLAGQNLWRTVTPTDTDIRAQIYYRDLHSQYRDKLSTLVCIKTAIDAIKQKNISFIMTYIDELVFETEWHTNTAILDLQNYVRPYMTKFNGQTFLDWAKQKGFPISETLHPLEDAHRAASELIYSNFDTILHKV